MTGAEHYRAAEHILRQLVTNDNPASVLSGKEDRAALMAAQVHATLAVAASVGAAASAPPRDDGDSWSMWFAAIDGR